MIRAKIWNTLEPLRAALDKVRNGTQAGGFRFAVPGRTFAEEPRWEVIFRDGDLEAETYVEVVTYATQAEIAEWQRRPDAEIRGTGMTWRNTGPAKKKRRAA